MKSLITLGLIAVIIFPAGSQTIETVCFGDTLALYMDPSPGALVQWEESADSVNFTPVSGATSDTFMVKGAQDNRYYRAIITGSSCDPYPTEVKKVVVSPPPQLSVSGLDSVYCVSDSSVTLSAVPSGGFFSGPGVSVNIFDPVSAGNGSHQVVYSYEDAHGCTHSLSVPVEVMAHPTLADAGPDSVAQSLTIAMWANTPVYGTGEWAIVSGGGGSFDSIHSPVAEFTGMSDSIYLLTWTITNPPCDSSTDTVMVTMPGGPSLPSVSCGSPAYTLYVHPTDNAGPTSWGCIGIVAGASDDNDGQANTDAIVSACGATSAAAICDNLTAYGYSDWYLPAYNELDCLRNNAAAIGGFHSEGYWSSTEGTGIFTSNARMRTFPSGMSGYSGKSSSHRIRCVRRD